jgi:glucokinase
MYDRGSYRMADKNIVVLGIDIGGTNTKMALVNRTGRISVTRTIPTDAYGTSPEPFLNRLYELIDEVLASATDEIAGIGVSMHGELDDELRGAVLGLNTPALCGVDMLGLLSERYQMRVIINNDLTAHTLGEYYFGCGRGVKRFMCLAVGTGLGAGVLVDGKPLLIDGGNSGNTGLVVIDPDAPIGANGMKGSAEDLCGVSGIERLAQAYYGRTVAAHEVIAAARTGKDTTAVEIMQQIGRFLGHTLATLSVIFYPHKIALTGGTTTGGDALLVACRERFDELAGGFFGHIVNLPKSHYQMPEIVLGEGGADSGILGATVELLGLYQR